jgi:PadR family transcriptional regulator PadR
MEAKGVDSRNPPRHQDAEPNGATNPQTDDFSISKLEEEILNLLLGQELYGLQISQAYEAVSGGKRKLSIGTLYPTLSRLERRGLVTSRMVDRPDDDKGGARRKLFKITSLGSRALVETEDFRRALSGWQPA